MSRKDQRIDSLFGDLAPPDPPLRFREQVMGPALEALRQDPVPDIWTRIWNSRAFRLAWAGSVSALVLCHLGLTTVRTDPEQGQPVGALDEELAEVMDLPRLRTDIQPLAGILGAPAAEDIDGKESRPAGDRAETTTEENSA